MFKGNGNFKKRGIAASVVNMHTIKPIDKEAIDEACNSKMIISVEEHNVFGGLGTSISEYLSSLKSHPKLLTIGIDDYYSKGGSYNFLKEKHIHLQYDCKQYPLKN